MTDGGVTVADVAVSAGVGLCATGVTIAVVQLVIAWVNRRADQRLGIPLYVLDMFLDWLTDSVVGTKRLDHEPMYSCVVSAIFLVGLFWLLAIPLPPWALYALPLQAQVALAANLFLGAGTCLYGIFMGTFIDPWRATVRIRRGLFRRELPSPPPLDIRRPYRVGASGIPSVFLGLIYYSVVLWMNTPAVLTGPTTIFLCFSCLGLLFQWLRFLMENRKINKALPVLIEQEVNRRVIAEDVAETTSTSREQTR